jgi:hypothetical protein
MMPRRLPLLLVMVFLVVACGSDGDSSATATSTTTILSEPTGGQGGPPSGQPLVEGLPVIEVLSPAGSGVGDAPLFSWDPVDGATRYFVSVLGPEGPLWGWQGEETQIYFGGLPIERPAGWAGPNLVAGSCWSVFARGADGHVMAVSEFLPVSPEESPGHTCIPGSGSGVG